MSSSSSVSELRERFQRQFGASPRIYAAPGRVNLIGEHTDYNQGFVMPAAIEFQTWVAVAPRRDRKLVISSVEFGQTHEFALDEPNPVPRKDWTDYVRGVAVVCAKSGIALRGANLMIHGNVPMGAGLSSSASLEVAVALALLGESDNKVSGAEVARLCQRAENEFVGANCGIMDQFIAVHGAASHALLLDCRSLHYELLPIPSGVVLVICNSMVKHSIAGGEYNLRRSQCAEGVRLLQGSMPQIESLRDVTLDDLQLRRSEIPELIYRRCRHVVSENERTTAAAAALRSGNLAQFGQLMAESHRSLRDDYEVSAPELDALVEAASCLPGVIGSRMTGGGFGGCTINLAQSEAVEPMREQVRVDFQKRFGIIPDIYTSVASAGAGEVVEEARC